MPKKVEPLIPLNMAVGLVTRDVYVNQMTRAKALFGQCFSSHSISEADKLLIGHVFNIADAFLPSCSQCEEQGKKEKLHPCTPIPCPLWGDFSICPVGGDPWTSGLCLSTQEPIEISAQRPNTPGHPSCRCTPLWCGSRFSKTLPALQHRSNPFRSLQLQPLNKWPAGPKLTDGKRAKPEKW